MKTNNRYISIEENNIGIDQLVNYKIAAKILGLSPRTIKDMGSKRAIPIYKIGVKTTRFLVRDLLDWIDEKKIEKI